MPVPSLTPSEPSESEKAPLLMHKPLLEQVAAPHRQKNFHRMSTLDVPAGSYMKRDLNSNFSGNEVYYTISLYC